VDFAEVMGEGLTVMETDAKGDSAREIGELWDYLAEQLAKV
jgi:hypothetical protein